MIGGIRKGVLFCFKETGIGPTRSCIDREGALRGLDLYQEGIRIDRGLCGDTWALWEGCGYFQIIGIWEARRWGVLSIKIVNYVISEGGASKL